MRSRKNVHEGFSEYGQRLARPASAGRQPDQAWHLARSREELAQGPAPGDGSSLVDHVGQVGQAIVNLIHDGSRDQEGNAVIGGDAAHPVALHFHHLDRQAVSNSLPDFGSVDHLGDGERGPLAEGQSPFLSRRQG
jgi:hypothetical protein